MSLFLLYLLVLRVAHIVGAVVWVGGAIIYYGFVEPTARATAPESRNFVGHLMTRRHFSRAMSVAGEVTVIAGALLYWHVSGGLS